MWIAWGVPLVVIGGLALALVALVLFLTAPYRAAAIPIQGRHILITGGSSGIGLEIAKLAAAEGARVVSLIARDPKKLADAERLVVEYCKDVEVKVNTYSADVKNVGSIKVAIEAAVKDSGFIEVLILSHGVSCVLTFEDGTVENYDHVIDTNLKGNIYTLKAALPHIKANGGPASICMLSSQAGQVGVYGYSVYAASKFALRGLAECLQQELVDRNIRLSLVYPPDTMTPMFVEDLKTIPEITKILSGTSTALDAMTVARASLDGLKAGRFHINCNLEGAALSIVGAGMGPQPSLLLGVTEILSMGLFRTVALFVQRDWYGTIFRIKRKDLEVKKIKLN